MSKRSLYSCAVVRISRSLMVSPFMKEPNRVNAVLLATDSPKHKPKRLRSSDR